MLVFAMTSSQNNLLIPSIPAEGFLQAPDGKLAKWLLHGAQSSESSHHSKPHPWYLVLWLTGVDYFSTLGYQPGIALLAAGALSPIATLFLVFVTLFAAYPVYAQVAGRSFAGQGSIAMLENLLPGWSGKLFVLLLIGFATTDFIITMTLSAADAAQHAIENPYLHAYLGEESRIALTLILLALLAAVFFKGFSEAIGVAIFIAVPYLLMNVVVIGASLAEIYHHPELYPSWMAGLKARGDWTMVIIASGLIFPKLALGMSGFETGVTVMSHVENPGKSNNPPAGRIAGTRKLLLSAAIIMSVLLLCSSFVTALLIPEVAYQRGGPASGRALAYLAHTYLGSGFGTAYDVVTIAILWFAGASAMAGMLNLIPRYLPRFGMAPVWVAHPRPLVLILLLINVIVTIIFKADVEAQGGAYATGVLMLMLSAAAAVALALWHEAATKIAGKERSRTKFKSAYFWMVTIVFTYTFVENMLERPDGVIIAIIFSLVILIFSALSRYARSKEFRVEKMFFADEESRDLWSAIKDKKVNLVPMRHDSNNAYADKKTEITKYYKVSGPMAFVHVTLLDNRSEFLVPLKLEIRRHGNDYVMQISGATSIANTIAYLSELIDPISLFLGLTRRNLVTQALNFLFLGEGEIGLVTYSILLNHWEWTPEDDVRPLIFLVSE